MTRGSGFFEQASSPCAVICAISGTFFTGPVKNVALVAHLGDEAFG
jgi:hypothetical protein